ncbi:nucleotidyltransferase domain-containing protein [Macromonas nakdongensis]|uniref:nucleotidyltransferase domain-containing protein n=1 Tax=Macromonas nakdongensis TaxID=1843082 RepID=UPI0012FEC277|nr:nucleotidyltransferase domain-containing protein [Macromonas nakdongensis]
MRLSPQQTALIKRHTTDLFGAQAQVRLFGSRLDDTGLGGDIDLLVTSPLPVERPALLPAQLATRLQLALGDQRIDVVLEAPNLLQLPIHRIAHAEGQLL